VVENQAERRPEAPATPPANRSVRLIIIWSAVAAVALVALAASLVYTEESSFCRTCHEMRPYYSAWQASPHGRSAECVDCHVDAGVLAHLAHKPIALKEVWDHFFRDNRFPNYAVDLPNSRCLRCHPNVTKKVGAVFTHKTHETYARCKDCHAQVGHAVSLASLEAEGVLQRNATNPPSPASPAPSILTGHVKVVCQECHDQAKMKCTSCHRAPHESRGECSNCHQPGTKFIFTHPDGTDCASCHEPPAGHFGTECGKCHRVGKKFTFRHPTDKDCASCHKAPSRHFGADCARCHRPSVPFVKTTFTHRGNTGEHSYRSFPCAKCHPRGYSSASCTCHGGSGPG